MRRTSQRTMPAAVCPACLRDSAAHRARRSAGRSIRPDGRWNAGDRRIADEALDHRARAVAAKNMSERHRARRSARSRSMSRWRSRCSRELIQRLARSWHRRQASCLARRGSREMAAKGIAGETAMEIGSHDAAVPRLRPIRRIADHGEGPLRNPAPRCAEMDLIARHGSPLATWRRRPASVSCRHRSVVSTSRSPDPATEPGAPSRPCGIVDRLAQHLIAAADAEDGAAAACMGGEVDVPALGAQGREIGDGRFGAGKDDEIGVARQRRCRAGRS